MKAVCNGLILADNVKVADNFAKRFVGLMGRKKLEQWEGLILTNTFSIHCFFMKFPIDVIYLSKERKVLGIETLNPWGIGKHFKATVDILELSQGVASKVSVGDMVVLTYYEGEGRDTK